MPILERDPWRLQYFTNVLCPPDVIVPTDDIDAWPLNPRHDWIYDRLRVAQSQGIVAAPHGVVPPSYPVFSKPIINLRGMGLGSRIINSAADMAEHSQPGHFWMPLLAGDHHSTDCAIINGEVAWMRHAFGIPARAGMFRHWVLLHDLKPEVNTYLSKWIATNLAGYTGMVNCETIGSRIIEAHLRFTDQWCDLNGDGWIKAVVQLHAEGRWQYRDGNRREGYSIPLFAKPDRIYRHPSPEFQQAIREMTHVNSLQITFHDGVDPLLHPMPPGGMRLGLINCWNLEAGYAARDELAKAFPADAIIPT